MEPRQGTILYVGGTTLSDQALGRGVDGKTADALSSFVSRPNSLPMATMPTPRTKHIQCRHTVSCYQTKVNIQHDSKDDQVSQPSQGVQGQVGHPQVHLRGQGAEIETSDWACRKHRTRNRKL